MINANYETENFVLNDCSKGGYFPDSQNIQSQFLVECFTYILVNNHNILIGGGAMERNCGQACKNTALETKKQLFY